MAKPRRKAPTLAPLSERQITRVAAYLRVSTDMQARSGLGLGDQRRQVETMATLKGWPSPTVYMDEGVSGTKETRDRPALKQMMDAVARGELDAIIVNSLDRLARKSRLTLELSEEFQRRGVTLVSVKENFDTSTPSGRLVFGFMAQLAEYERDLIAERTRAALAEHSRRDGEAGGRLPYGYLRDEEGGLRVEHAQARVVRRIFTLRREGLTLRAIAARLNQRHTHSPQGAHWHHSSVAAVLANEPYYHGGKRGASEVRWPAILKDGKDRHTAKSVSKLEGGRAMHDDRPYAEQFTEAQTITEYEIRGQDYPRIRYGSERDWPANPAGCHDCGAKPGQYHLLGCDVEQCPRCGGQSISCGCDDIAEL